MALQKWHDSKQETMSRYLYILLIIGGFITVNSAFSQTPFSGEIKELGDQHANIVLEYFKEDSWKNLLNKPIDTDGKFSFPVTFDHNGQYRIRLTTDPKRWGDFIVVVADIPKDGIRFTLNYRDLQGRPISINESDEQRAYEILMNEYNRLTLNTDSLNRREMKYLTREKEFFATCERMNTEYPKTYTGEILSRLLRTPIAPGWNAGQPIADSILDFNVKHAMDMIPFGNEDILNHIGFVRKLNLLYDNCSTNDQQIRDYVDLVMSKSLINDNVSAFVFRFVLDQMIDHKNEVGLSYLITWYAGDCSENDLVPEATKNLLKALANCEPGKKIELMSLPDLTGKKVAMSEVFSKNKITLLFFWKSSCSHCKEFEPILENLYRQYHPLGIEVYAIGTDKVQTDWEKEVASQNPVWPSVFLAYDNRKDFSKRFPVPSTPTIIAVDGNGVIIRRLIMRSKLEQALKEMLNDIH